MAPTPPRAPVSSVVPRPTAECHTVREILPPWHLLQEKVQKREAAVAGRSVVPAEQGALDVLAAQEAANSQWKPVAEADSAPHSGVRMSDPGGDSPIEIDDLLVDVEDPLLSFKVYTLAELERRSDAPGSMRLSRGSFDSTAARGRARWRRAFVALRAFGLASLAWWKTPAPRPNPKVALRQPFDVLGDELQVVVESIDWKKHGVTTGIVIGATLTLLFAVLTAAELTDDLKPGTSAHLASSETSVPATGARAVAPALNAVSAVSAPPVIAVQPVAAEPSTSIGDIDEPEAAPVPPKAAGKKKPKTTKLTYRNPDAIFNP